MSLSFLRTLADSRLPVTLTRPSEINDLLVLRAAGLVAAVTMKAPGDQGAGEVARCLALTPQGRAALRDGRQEPGLVNPRLRRA
uniref:hypothetical protein n=1 Tax=Variovorax sp. BK018 TaxID=3450241 RepID=UPI0040394AB7